MGLVKEYICLIHGYRQQCDDGQRERGQGLGGEGRSGDGKGDTCNSGNNKNKEKSYCVLYSTLNLLGFCLKGYLFYYLENALNYVLSSKRTEN